MATIATSSMDEGQVRALAERGGHLARLRLGLAAGFRLAKNPSDTQQVFLLAVASDWDRLSRLHARLAAAPGGARLLRERPAIDSSAVDYQALRELGPETLGGAYVRSLDENGLDPDIFGMPPGLDSEVGYVVQRVRQTHDIWHVLTGLGTDIRGEIALQAFSHAQLGQRFSWFITVFGTLIYGLRYPGTLRLARTFHAVGKQVPYLLAMRWEDMWSEPLSDVRARLGLAQVV